MAVVVAEHQASHRSLAVAAATVVSAASGAEWLLDEIVTEQKRRESPPPRRDEPPQQLRGRADAFSPRSQKRKSVWTRHASSSCRDVLVPEAQGVQG